MRKRKDRWPNTPHWQRIEAALRVIGSKSWRRKGEEILGVERGQLRWHIDREDIEHDDFVEIENKVSAALIAHLQERKVEAIEAEAVAEQFALDSKRRRFEVWRSNRDRHLS